MDESQNNFFYEKRWAFAAIILGFLVGFLSAYLCIIWHFVIFGFNIMYILSPILAGVVETVIARRKYGKSTGAISALLTFLLINIYGWFLPGTYVDPTKEPATLSLITIIAIILTIQAAFPTLMNYILSVVVIGTLKRIIDFFIFLPSKIQGKSPRSEEKIEITGPSPDEIFLDKLSTPILSIPPIEGKIKKYVGVVTGEVLAEKKESTGGRLSNLLKIMEPTKLEDLNLGQARKLALSRMLENAQSMGADAVTEVTFEYISMGGLQGSVTTVIATGTAVITQNNNNNLGKKESEDNLTSRMDEILNDFGRSENFSATKESISRMDQRINEKIIEKNSADDLSNQISQILNEKSNQIMNNWELSTKNDISELKGRYSDASSYLKVLNKSFKEDREHINKKFNEIEDRIKKLET